jgi:hypothetical protein
MGAPPAFTKGLRSEWGSDCRVLMDWRQYNPEIGRLATITDDTGINRYH